MAFGTGGGGGFNGYESPGLGAPIDENHAFNPGFNDGPSTGSPGGIIFEGFTIVFRSWFWRGSKLNELF